CTLARLTQDDSGLKNSENTVVVGDGVLPGQLQAIDRRAHQIYFVHRFLSCARSSRFLRNVSFCLLRNDDGLLVKKQALMHEVVTFYPGPLRGTVDVPGDKSISHRALIAAARTEEPLRISNLNPGRDVLATRKALAALGVRLRTDRSDTIVDAGPLISPASTLDCMNSGSTVRMLLGACAGAGVRARFDGDDSLRRRPMEPVAGQLRAFGARIDTTGGHLPLVIDGTPEIQTRHFILLAPSAQVKSALLFAGLFAGVPVEVEGDCGSRDHTERLLCYLGADIEWNERGARLGRSSPASRPIEVVGDFSAAAFFIAAAAITPGSSVLVRGVGTNP